MKRSAQVSLVLMTAAGVGGAAYLLTPSDSCRQTAPNAVANDPQRNCSSRSSSGSSSHFYGGSGSSGSGTSTSTSPAAASTSSSRGGFGSIGSAFSSGG